jgi:hypothetical protein
MAPVSIWRVSAGVFLFSAGKNVFQRWKDVFYFEEMSEKERFLKSEGHANWSDFTDETRCFGFFY